MWTARSDFLNLSNIFFSSLVPEHFDLTPSSAYLDIDKGLCMYSRVWPSGRIKDPVPLIEMSRASCPGGRLPPSFIHQVILITGLNKLYDCMLSPSKWP